MHIVILYTFSIPRLLMSASEDDHKRSFSSLATKQMKNVAKDFSYEIKNIYFPFAKFPSKQTTPLLPFAENMCFNLFNFARVIPVTLVTARMCNNSRCDKRAEFALSTPDFPDKRDVCRIDW